MILAGLIMGATVIAGASVIATFWNSIVRWLKRVFEKLQSLVQGVIHGTRIFFKKMKEAAIEISKHYSKVGTKWQETIVDKNVSVNEIPPEYLKKMNRKNKEYEFTEELEMQLNQ